MARISQTAAQRISKAVTNIERISLTTRAQDAQTPQTNYGSYVVKVPSGGMPARSGVTLGTADCVIQLIDKTTREMSDGETVTVLNLTEESIAADSYVVVTRTKTGDYIVDAGATESATEPVIASHRNFQGYNYLGLLNAGLTGHTPSNPMFIGSTENTIETKQSHRYLTDSNDPLTIGSRSGAMSLLKPGVYAYTIPWAIVINDPPPENDSVELLTQAVEFEYGGVDGHVIGIRNALSSGGNRNPLAVLYQYPVVEISVFLYDNATTVLNAAIGHIFAGDRGGGGFDTVIRGFGTDSNGDPYDLLWGDYIDGNLGRTWQGCISGAIAISQDQIDALQGYPAIGIEFTRSAINGGASDFNWNYTFGGHVIYSPLNTIVNSLETMTTVPTIPAHFGMIPTTN